MPFTATASPRARLTAPTPNEPASDAATGVDVIVAWSVARSGNPPGAVTIEPLRTLAAAGVALLLIVFAPPSAIAPEKPPDAATAIATPTATASIVGFVSAITLTDPVAVTVESSIVAVTFSLRSLIDTEMAAATPSAKFLPA